MQVSAKAFAQFVETQFKLRVQASRQRDRARQKPQVSASHIFRALLWQAVLELGSFLALDHWLRGASAALWLAPQGSRRGSDTTLLKALGQWDWGRLRQSSYALHAFLSQRGYAAQTLSSGRRVKLAVVDGSCMGGVWAVALGFAGRVWQTLDLERSRGRGHELAAARRLLGRVSCRLGAGWATHLLYDGLMAVRADFERAILRWGVHLLVKTTEQSLEVIQSCRAAWQGPSEAALGALGVEVARGVDAARQMQYVICAQGGIEWEGLRWKLKVAWVRQTPLKGARAGQSEEYWVLSTDESLRAEEMRALAQARWGIENRAFKALNAAIGSKKRYLKNPQVRLAQILMGSMGQSLVAAFREWLSEQAGGQSWDAKQTRRWVGRELERTVQELSGCGSSP